MARPLRPQESGLIYHVMGRGNNKMAIFLDDLDYSRFVAILKRALEGYEVECWTSCQMPNHHHLIVRTLHGNLSRFVRQVHGVYAQWWNKRHGRVGHVFQARFKAQVIEDGLYLLRACRYVLLNPVRGHLCAAPQDWRWSSYRALADARPSHIAVESLFERLGDGDVGETRARFVAFVNGEPDTEIADFFRTDRRVIGTEQFAARFRAAAMSASKEVPARERRIGTPSLSDILATSLEESDGLALGIVRAHRDFAYPVEEIARCAGLSASTVVRLLRRTPASGDALVVEWG